MERLLLTPTVLAVAVPTPVGVTLMKERTLLFLLFKPILAEAELMSNALP